MPLIDPQPKLRRLLLNTLRLLDDGGWGDLSEKIARQGVKSFDLTFTIDAPVVLGFCLCDGEVRQLNTPYPGHSVVIQILKVWGLDGISKLSQGFSVYADTGGLVRWRGHGVVVVPDKKV